MKHPGRTIILIVATSALLLFSLSRVISPPRAETLKAGMAKPIMEQGKNALKQSN